MAFIKQFQRKDTTPRKSAHQESKASYSVFERDGEKFLQIVTYGHGQKPDKISQTIQLGREGASDLYGILKRTFSFD
jgi:hypothetical protein